MVRLHFDFPQRAELFRRPQELELTQEQFIDLCILMGCDYCGTVRGIGPVRALSLVQKHNSIDKILDSLDTKKYDVPPSWPYAAARDFFINPDVSTPEEVQAILKWTGPDEEGEERIPCVRQTLCFLCPLAY